MLSFMIVVILYCCCSLHILKFRKINFVIYIDIFSYCIIPPINHPCPFLFLVFISLPIQISLLTHF